MREVSPASINRPYYPCVRNVAVEITFAGALFEKHPEEGQDPQFKGSMIVCPGENVEEALEIIKNDIYATTGVWDVEKAQIYPVSSIYSLRCACPCLVVNDPA